MNSRQRILAALEHRDPDRIPLDFSGHRSSGISAIAYHKLRRHLGLAERPIRVYDPIQQLAVVDDDLLELFGVDTLELGRAFAREDSHWTDWVLPDGTPCKLPAWVAPEREGGDWVLHSKSGRVLGRMPEGGLYFEQVYYPFAEKSDLDRIEEASQESMWSAAPAPPGPLAEGLQGRKALREGARSLRENTERAILALFGGNLMEGGHSLYRHDNYLMLLAAEPGEAHRFLDRLVELYLEKLEQFLEDVGEYIDIIVFGDDLGTQNGPMVSPEMYREFFKPRHALLWRRAKRDLPLKVMLHCCGGVRGLLPDLIEAGLDAINPVQISCRGMDPAELKKEFGSELTFWGGGCDTRDILPKASPEAVKRHVKKQIEILSPGGGFVFQQVHNILADVPPENVAAMFEALKEWS